MAHVDSSVGGKTGLNHRLGKNLIGPFYQPQCVLVDTDTLNTLPNRELASRLAEVIKYGLIRDAPFFEWQEKNMHLLMSRDAEAFAYAIKRSCENKAEVVSQDEKESGLRETLNLGHTFGHAIETSYGYGHWLHGEAVAVGTELHNYLSISTTTSIIVDRSSDEDYLRIDINISFPALSCEFASVDVSDVLGTNRLNITKTVRKYSIDKHLRTTGSEFDTGPTTHLVKHDDENDEEYGEGSVTLNSQNFDRISHQHSILVVNFYAPWCYWSNRLKPSWEKAAKIIRERHDPEVDGRIIMGKVDCTKEIDLCRSHHIQGYPSIRIFRKGSDVKDEHGHHDHESYYGDRDTDTLVNTMENLVAPIALESVNLSLEDKSGTTTENAKRPAPLEAGCRVEGFVRVKKVPGNLVISARSGAHSFDASRMNMSHVITAFSFGKKITPRVMSDIKRILPYIGVSHDKLNGKAYLTDPDDHANVTVEHYIQVVKTEVMRSSHQLIENYEFTAHSSLIHAYSVPVVKFHYEPSPMQVLITENPKSFSHFITNLCAIIGGVFTVAGILDSILHNTLRLVKKVELGKNF